MCRHQQGHNLRSTFKFDVPGGATLWQSGLNITRAEILSAFEKSLEERVFGRRSRCKGPYAAILAPGIDAAGKSAEHDNAVNLVTQACSAQDIP
jgi:hypothetical protein